MWLRDAQTTPQALAMIAALEASQQKGSIAEDYDASRWPARLAALKTPSQNTDTVANFDAALTLWEQSTGCQARQVLRNLCITTVFE